MADNGRFRCISVSAGRVDSGQVLALGLWRWARSMPPRSALLTELDEDPREMPMPSFRFWLVASTIPRALSRYYCAARTATRSPLASIAMLPNTVNPR